MKILYVMVGVLVVGGIAFFFLRPASNPSAGISHKITQKPETNPAVAIVNARQPSGNADATNGPLASAYETAAFIGRVYDSVPSGRTATRNHLKGLQAFFFVSDYVMAAKTNQSLPLTTSAIINAFTNVTSGLSDISNRAAMWAERPGTLTDHYQGISEIPEEKEHIKTIKAALTENGVAIDTESDLLMDCIRYATIMTDIYEMYGPNPKKMEEATPYPEALNSLVNASDAVFQHRFETRFGLNSDAVTNLMKRLKEVRLYSVSPADVEIPAHIQ